MASLLYGSLLADIVNGDVDFAVDEFYAMLVTSAYAPDQDAHNRRDDVTNEVAGTGYTAGGAEIVPTVGAYDGTNNRLDIDFASVDWPASTITARAAVIYKRTGGAASTDPLIAYVDFGADRSSVAGTFTFDPTSPLRLQL